MEQRMEVVKNLSQKITPIAKIAPATAQQRDPSADYDKMRTCAVLGCEEYMNTPTALFFRFPEKPSLRKVWTDVTGRSNWTPNDCSFVCRSHFTADCVRRIEGRYELDEGSVPTLHLPKSVLEVEYIDEEMLERERDTETESEQEDSYVTSSSGKIGLLKLFTEVQKKQKHIANVAKRILHDKQMLRLRTRDIKKLKEKVRQKKILLQKRNRDRDDKEEILLMPTRYTDEAKNFALSIYGYSPEAYIYLRNALKTMLPSTLTLDLWLKEGFAPKCVMVNSDCLKVVTETKDNEMLCKVSIV